MDWTRAMGILILDEGVVIRAYPNAEDRTDIEANAGITVGAIVRLPGTGRWTFDEPMRRSLGIRDAPDFESDLEAGKNLREHLPPLSEVREKIRDLLRKHHTGNNGRG